MTTPHDPDSGEQYDPADHALEARLVAHLRTHVIAPWDGETFWEQLAPRLEPRVAVETDTVAPSPDTPRFTNVELGRSAPAHIVAEANRVLDREARWRLAAKKDRDALRSAPALADHRCLDRDTDQLALAREREVVPVGNREPFGHAEAA